MRVLLLKALEESWINLRLLNLSFKQYPESLRLLNVKRKLTLILLEFSKLKCLLQISKFSFLLVIHFIYLFHLEFQICNLTFLSH